MEKSWNSTLKMTYGNVKEGEDGDAGGNNDRIPHLNKNAIGDGGGGKGRGGKKSETRLAVNCRVGKGEGKGKASGTTAHAPGGVELGKGTLGGERCQGQKKQG